jgi:hypothetical protein
MSGRSLCRYLGERRCLEIAPLPSLLKTTVNSHSGGWTDKREPITRPTALGQRPKELRGQRARRCGRPRVSEQAVKEVIMTHISTTTAAVGTQ